VKLISILLKKNIDSSISTLSFHNSIVLYKNKKVSYFLY